MGVVTYEPREIPGELQEATACPDCGVELDLVREYVETREDYEDYTRGLEGVEDFEEWKAGQWEDDPPPLLCLYDAPKAKDFFYTLRSCMLCNKEVKVLRRKVPDGEE